MAYENISNENLGALIRASYQKHAEYVAQMTPQWIEEGNRFKTIRQELNITQKQISDYIGVSPQVVAKFEKGESIRSRKMLQHSYQNAIILIQYNRNSIIMP